MASVSVSACCGAVHQPLLRTISATTRFQVLAVPTVAGQPFGYGVVASPPSIQEWRCDFLNLLVAASRNSRRASRGYRGYRVPSLTLKPIRLVARRCHCRERVDRSPTPPSTERQLTTPGDRRSPPKEKLTLQSATLRAGTSASGTGPSRTVGTIVDRLGRKTVSSTRHRLHHGDLND